MVKHDYFTEIKYFVRLKIPIFMDKITAYFKCYNIEQY